MTVRRLDPVTGDISTSGVQFISQREEIAQTIRTRLRLFLGEYFRNINEGTPWFQSILTKRGTLSNKDAIIKQRIVRTDGVTRIIEYSTDYDINARIYSISAVVETIYGEISLSLNEVI